MLLVGFALLFGFSRLLVGWLMCLLVWGWLFGCLIGWFRVEDVSNLRGV